MALGDKQKTYANIGIALYLFFTVTAVAVLVVDIGIEKEQGQRWFLRITPLSNLEYTMTYITLYWILLGSILVLIRLNLVNRNNILFFAFFYIFAFLYLVVLIERIEYGDVSAYIQGAQNICDGKPFHRRYIYPPLWATCLQPLIIFKYKAIVAACLAINYMSLLLFFILLCKVLQKYGFSKDLAAISVFLALCVNTPVLRNMHYVQVNIHVANLILFCILSYKYSVFLSAIALCVAVHIKVSPIILIFPFLIIRDWKWIISFTAVFLGIILFTSLVNDFQYYIYFLENVRNLGDDKCLFNNSINSFLNATFALLKLDKNNARFLARLIKAFLVAASIMLAVKSGRKKAFYDGDQKETILFNYILVMLLAMVWLSPRVWSHHIVFVILPFIIVLKYIDSPADLILCSLTYIFLFLTPVFAFYPFSYYRLLGGLLFYIIMFRILTRRVIEPAKWYTALNDIFDKGIINKLATLKTNH